MDKYNSVFCDGIDRCGKNTIVKYIHHLSKHRYMAYDRGIFSNVTYSRMFNRDTDYDINQYKNFVFVYLTCDEEDWNIRCKLTNEPTIDYKVHREEFDKTFADFKEKGFNIVTLNTSHMTPYDAAKKVVQYVDYLNQ